MTNKTLHPIPKPQPRHDTYADQRMEQAVLQAKQEWERTFDSVPDCILILGDDLCARRLNISLANRLGAHPRELLGKPLDELAGMGGEASVDLRQMAGEALCSSAELGIPRWGGHFLVTVSPFLDAEGTRNGTIIVAHDITRWKLLEQQLEQSRRLEALGTLAGGIAHDFNNILGVILGYAEMMQSAAKGGPQEHRIQEIMRAGGRAKELIGQILTFSRQGEGRNVALRLAPLVKEVLQHLQETMPTGISVQRSFQTDKDLVLADPSMIHQVVLNLCTNSIQAMRDTGGTLEVGMDEYSLGENSPPQLADLQPGAYVRLNVRDTGPGIPEDIARHIFEPFFTTKRPGEGTGMGLAVAHGIVRRLGGAITVESPPEGGAILHVHLPQVQGSVDDKGKASDKLPRGQATLLLVDDEPALLAVMAEALTGMGYRVITASSGAEALDCFSANPQAVDLLLTDQVMPQMSGLTLAASILALRPDLPVVLCSGNNSPEVLATANRLGIREVLGKPTSQRQMAEALQRALTVA